MEDLQGANKDLWYLKEALAAVTASREELITQIQLLNVGTKKTNNNCVLFLTLVYLYRLRWMI